MQFTNTKTANVPKTYSYLDSSLLTKKAVSHPSAVNSFMAVVPLTDATNCIGERLLARWIHLAPNSDTTNKDNTVAGHHHMVASGARAGMAWGADAPAAPANTKATDWTVPAFKTATL